MSNKEFIVKNGLIVTGDANVTSPTLLVAGQNVLSSFASANNYAGSMANSANAYAASLTPDLSPPFNVANAAFDKANAANVLAYDTGIGANAYSVSVGAAGNAYVNVSTGAANAYSIVVGAASNDYTNTVGTSANNYAGVMANSANGIADVTYIKKTATTQIITGDLQIAGNLIISGNATQISANNLSVQDPLIFLAANNISDIVDIGFVGHYNNGTANVHTGVYRDHASKEYFVFNDLSGEPELINDIVPYANNMVNAVLNADLRTSNLNLGGANAIVWIKSAFDTVNAAYTSSNADYVVSNAAFTVANAAFNKSNAGPATISNIAPSSPANGALWWSNTYGRLFVYYNDGDSAQWVDAAPATDVSIAFDVANAAYGKANAALANTTGTFAGTLTVTGAVATPNVILNNDGFVYWGAGDGSTSIRGNSSSDYIAFTTVGSERLRIDSSGRVGIGYTSPRNILQVGGSAFPTLEISGEGTAQFTGGYIALTANAATSNGQTSLHHVLGTGAADLNNNYFAIQQRSNNGTYIANIYQYDYSSQQHKWYTNNSQRAVLDANGNFGIGLASPIYKFDVQQTAATGTARFLNTNAAWATDVLIAYAPGGGSQTGALSFSSRLNGDVWLQSVNTAGSMLFMTAGVTERMRINASGNVGIGNTSPKARLHVAAASTTAASLTWDATAGQILRNEDSELAFGLLNASPFPLWIQGRNTLNAARDIVIQPLGGRVGIGTTSPAYTLHVNGSFAANTKSFVIDHPSKPGMKLRYGSLEGPENGVYIRGRVSGQNYIEYPDYWSSLVDIDTTTVQLTPIGDTVMPRVAGVLEDRILLSSDNKNIDCYYFIQAERKDVEKLVVEFDA